MEFLKFIKDLPIDSVSIMAGAVLLLPLLSFVLLIFFGDKLPRKGDWLACALLFLAFVISIPVFIQVWGKNPHHWRFTWIDLKAFGANLPVKFTLGLLVDNSAAVMMSLVTGITFLVHLFSIEYMKGDKYYSRYFAYLGLFAFAMLGIVMADNLFLMYIFWELVGLGSYLLIGFWFYKPAPPAAAKKAFLVNRIGDIGMFIGILIIWTQFGTLDLGALKSFMNSSHIVGYEWRFTVVSNGVEVTRSLDLMWLTLAGLLLFCGCVGKSAQFPLHVWLPDAMEGPTTVSSLIHAATMVAAGVFMVGRIFVLLTPGALAVIAYTGAFTAFLAATIAITQNDIKRILAYSTISQLGFMVMGLGVGSYDAAFFHLVTHAFFKCCLFLTAGSVIHAMHHVEHELEHHGKHVHFDPQDIRFMGGLRRKMPVTFLAYVIACASLAGLPFFSGFLSKDAILVGAFGWADTQGGLAYLVPLLGFTTAFMTAFYMGRQAFMTFFGEFKLETLFDEARGAFAYIHESPLLMKIPLVTLAFMSFFFIFSPNPFNGHAGWFMHTMKIPAIVTPDAREMHTKETLTIFAHQNHLLEEGKIAEEVPVYLPKQQISIWANSHHRHYTGMGLSLVLALGGVFMAMVFYGPKFRFSREPDLFTEEDFPYKLSYNKWWFDEIYDWLFVKPAVWASQAQAWFDAKVVDGIVNWVAAVNRVLSYISGWFDYWVVDGLVNLTAYFSKQGGNFFRRFQTGRVQSYFIFMLCGIILFFVFYALI